MVNTFAFNFYMILKWTKSRGMQIKTIFKYLDFIAVFTQSKAHLSDGINRECTFQIQISNSLSISAHGFLCMNTDSWVNSAILLALNTRISHEWLFQDLRTKYVSKSVGWNLSDGRNAHEHLAFFNHSNSAFWSKYLNEDVLEKFLIY